MFGEAADISDLVSAVTTKLATVRSFLNKLKCWQFLRSDKEEQLGLLRPQNCDILQN